MAPAPHRTFILLIALVLVAAATACPRETLPVRDATAGAPPGDAVAADGPDVLTGHEAHTCTTDPGDDPQVVCSTQFPLVCITTYAARIAGADGGSRPRYVCRLSCTGPGQPCLHPGDVCCAGLVFSTGATTPGWACVPQALCETGASPDGGR